MLRKSVCVWVLLFGMVALSGSLQSAEVQEVSPAALDRLFEGQVYLHVDQQVGSAARHVQVSRFGNTIVITGEVENAAHAKVIDELVLDAAGIKRETPAGATVVPENSRECGGRRASGGNVKRRQIVSGNRDCSSLRSDQTGQAKGRVYNHLGVAASDPAWDVAVANLLLAEATVELVDAGFTQVLDRAVMRMVAQNGTLYILGNLDKMDRTRIKTVLKAFPGVRDVRFYTE
jgi:hypothetical protein